MFPAKRMLYCNIQDNRKFTKLCSISVTYRVTLCVFLIVYFLISPVSEMKM